MTSTPRTVARERTGGHTTTCHATSYLIMAHCSRDIHTSIHRHETGKQQAVTSTRATNARLNQQVRKRPVTSGLSSSLIACRTRLAHILALALSLALSHSSHRPAAFARPALSGACPRRAFRSLVRKGGGLSPSHLSPCRNTRPPPCAGLSYASCLCRPPRLTK